MTTPTGLAWLVDEPDDGVEVLVARVEATVRRRARLQLGAAAMVVLLAVLAGTEVISMIGRRPVPEVMGGSGLTQAASAVCGRTTPGRRLAAAAAAAASLVGCNGTPADGGVGGALAHGAVLEVVGGELEGRHEYRQPSDAWLVPADAERAAEAGLEGDQYAVTLEFLDDEFDYVRIHGSVGVDGSYQLEPSFRLDGLRFPAPSCEVALDAVPPGRTAGSFECADVSDAAGRTVVTVRGRFAVPDLREQGAG